MTTCAAAARLSEINSHGAERKAIYMGLCLSILSNHAHIGSHFKDFGDKKCVTIHKNKIGVKMFCPLSIPMPSKRVK